MHARLDIFDLVFELMNEGSVILEGEAWSGSACLPRSYRFLSPDKGFIP